MLKLMRDSFQQLKWILVAIVAVFILFIFVDWGAGGPNSGGAADQSAYAARVNGDTISTREYERSLYYMEKNYEQMYRQPLTPDQIAQMGLPKQVLESLIDQHLLLQQAKRLHLSASPEEIRQKILEIPTLNPDGKFVGQDLYARYVTSMMGFSSPAEFEEELAREITLGKMESALQTSVVVSPKAAEAEYRRNNESAKIKYILYPAAREAASVTVTPAEVQQYYTMHQAQYTHGEQRAAKYLIADYAKLRAQLSPSDAELRKIYEQRHEEFKSPAGAHILHILLKVDPGAPPAADAEAKAKAESIVKQLRAGADFAKLAQANSGDPSSSGKGGDMGWVDKGTTVDVFDKAAFTMPLNTISDPIRSADFGYHIIKVLERRPEGYRPFEEVRDRLRAQTADQLSKDRARDEITRVEARIKASKPKTADEFTALASGNVASNDSQWFSKTDTIPGMGNNPAFTTWAFAAKVNDVGEILGSQRGPVIPFLYAIRSAGVSPLDEVRAKVENDARMEKARALAQQALSRAIPAATVDAAGTKAGLTPAEATINRSGFIPGFTGDTSALVDAALSAPVGEVRGPVMTGDGAVLFQVTEPKKDDPATAQNRAQYTDNLRQQESRNLRASLLQRLRKSSTIDINKKLIEAQTPNQQAGV
ncbi:MAG: peptidyl-prolyl cis-trans isomerase [Acidobacteria bacterium]|nr:peptidyl-prolyl cis-trans isomerase [Acidobacteriota bacterium]MBV9069295.1 peptidyl-prolyl cis-trans isomerase [Acidobacteriota bacterium]MBV9184826.1 peptidyl-prolyl cis-trans isomerase [Acidobacteriota bacterium]